MSARIFLLMAAASAVMFACGAGGCAPSDNPEQRNATAQPTPAEPITPPSTQMTTLTGTLRGGMMAIGGETTGWTFVGDGAVGGIDLDVAQVRDAATRLDGKRVNVTGLMVDKRYVERGTVRMMRVEKIEEAK